MSERTAAAPRDFAALCTERLRRAKGGLPILGAFRRQRARAGRRAREQERGGESGRILFRQSMGVAI